MARATSDHSGDKEIVFGGTGLPRRSPCRNNESVGPIRERQIEKFPRIGFHEREAWGTFGKLASWPQGYKISPHEGHTYHNLKSHYVTFTF